METNKYKHTVLTIIFQNYFLDLDFTRRASQDGSTRTVDQNEMPDEALLLNANQKSGHQGKTSTNIANLITITK